MYDRHAIIMECHQFYLVRCHSTIWSHINFPVCRFQMFPSIFFTSMNQPLKAIEKKNFFNWEHYYPIAYICNVFQLKQKVCFCWSWILNFGIFQWFQPLDTRIFWLSYLNKTTDHIDILFLWLTIAFIWVFWDSN